MLRLYGLITKENRYIGIIIYDETTNEFRVIKEDLALNLAIRLGCLNVQIKQGKVVSTEGSLKRLPLYTEDLKLIKNKCYTVLGIDYDKNRYCVLDYNQRRLILTEQELRHQVSLCDGFANAYVNGEQRISFLRTEFVSTIGRSHHGVLEFLKDTEISVMDLNILFKIKIKGGTRLPMFSNSNSGRKRLFVDTLKNSAIAMDFLIKQGCSYTVYEGVITTKATLNMYNVADAITIEEIKKREF